MKRLFAALLLVNFLALSSAYAHTALVSSSPKNGAVLIKSPTSISITFNENLIKLGGKNPSRVSLADSKNSQVTLGKVAINKSRISAPITQMLSAGSYTIKYRVVSRDGHPVTGSIKFRVK